MCCCCAVTPGGQYGLRISLGAIFPGPIQIDVEAYLAFCKMGIGFVSWGFVADYLHLVLSSGSIMVRARASGTYGTRARFPWHTAFTAVPFFISCARPACLL